MQGIHSILVVCGRWKLIKGQMFALFPECLHRHALSPYTTPFSPFPTLELTPYIVVLHLQSPCPSL